MKHKRFKTPKAGEWVQPVKRGYLMECCDCALVHRLDFRVQDGRAQFRVFRAERYTARARKRRAV